MIENTTQPVKNFLDSVPDWYQAVARPNVLLDATVVLDVYHQGVLPNAKIGFTKQVAHYKDGFATYFRSSSQMEDVLKEEFLPLLKDSERIQLYSLEGKKVLAEADQCLQLAKQLKTVTEVKEFIPHLIATNYRSIQFITLIPYLTLNCLEQEGYSVDAPGPYQNIFDAFEFLRADSRILAFREELYPRLWKIIGEENSITPKLLNHISVGELETFVKENTLPESQELEKRKNGCIVWIDDTDQIRMAFETELVEMVSTIDVSIEDEDSFYGKSAYPGYIQGRVKIIHTSLDAEGFADGDIIVSTSPSPHLTPFLKRAGAILADEGGISSHAAIIAREFKIPCIIGTKIATKVLKDGDLVEVDAENGTVRVIKQ
jgi:phosphohistidine swiveling domain-containing protein